MKSVWLQVQLISAAQIIVSLTLLGIYEGYKVHFFSVDESSQKAPTAGSLSFKSPLDYIFYLALLNNIAAFFGLAGIMTAQKELIQVFFGWNAIQMVLVFYLFVDVVADVSISFRGEPVDMTPYENAAAAFLFFCFVLSIGASYFAVRALEEIRGKQKEDLRRLSVLSDTLQYETDV